MKNKFFKKPEEEQELEEGEEEIIQEQDEEAEVDSGGPGIASAAKNKLLLVAASSLFITAVIYFIFFKGNDAPKDNLEPVAPIIRPVDVARSENGESPFAIDDNIVKSSDDVALLEKPQTPDIPKLPELTAQEQKDGLLSLEDLAEKKMPVAEILPILPNQEIALANQNKPGEAAPDKLETPAVQIGTKAIEVANKLDPNYTDPKYAPIIVLSAPSQGQEGQNAGPGLGVGYDKNIVVLNGDPIRDLEKSSINVKTTFVDNRQNVVAQGKLLTAVLETAINTEIPGFVRAVVSRDVYGEAGNEVLISRGSRLFGSYSSEIVRGQGRVQINWTRLIRPDGVDMAIASSASDQFGRAGIQGDVDNRFGNVLAGSLLTSILSIAGIAVAENLINSTSQATTTINPQQGTVTNTANASNQAINNLSQTVTNTVGRLINDKLDTRPVITVPQGTRITVIVNADMNIPSIRN